MNKETIAPQPPTDCERAIVEAGRIIDALATGDGDALKDAWYQLGRYVRAALAEIRQTEPTKPHWTDNRKAANDCAGVG